MNNIPEVKLGIVVGSTDWLPSEIAVDIRKQIVELYNGRYEDKAYECRICIDDNELSVKRALKDLEKAECNAVCLCYANYGPETTGTLFAQEFNGPVMMLAIADEGNSPYLRDRRDALSGFINACYALKLRDAHAYIPAKPLVTCLQATDKIHDFADIARSLIGIKNLKVLSIGPRPSSYLASSAPNYLLYDLGIEVSEYSELEVYEAFKKHSEDCRISDLCDTMKKQFEVTKPEDEKHFNQFAQYELTLEDWIRGHKGKHKYVAMTSTCWPAFPTNFGFVPCYVNSRLTEKGIPVACEVDVYGAVSEYIGQCVSNSIVTLLNINNNVTDEIYNDHIKNCKFEGHTYKQSDLFIGYHCGVTPASLLTTCSLENHFVNNQLIGEDYSAGTIQGIMKPTKITLFRIQADRNSKLRAYVAQGQVLPVSANTYGGYGIIAIPELERFVRNVIIENQFPNHAAVIQGHHAEKLIDIVKQLGIEDIQYNHPESVPYPGENFYSAQPEWY